MFIIGPSRVREGAGGRTLVCDRWRGARIRAALCETLPSVMAANFARLPLVDMLANFPVCGGDSLREKSGDDGTEPVLKRLWESSHARVYASSDF